MRRRSLVSCVLVPLLAPAIAGCEGDPVVMGRADSGVIAQDGGMDGPLPLEPGMTFTYRSVMTARPTAAVAEHTTQWFLTLTIDSVTDLGAGQSSVTFSASNPVTMDDDWAATDDFDSWVGRLGPSLDEDTVSTVPVTSMLDAPPAIPPPPRQGQKDLPATGTFFIDVRDIVQLRADFAEANADRLPATSQQAGRWVFETGGVDDSVFYYTPSKERSIRLEYDPRGFLVRLDETLGESPQMPPHASNYIVLMSGP